MGGFLDALKARLGRLRHLDVPMVIAVVTLILLGASAIYSVALSQPNSNFGLLKRQGIGLLIGTGFALFFATSNYRLLKAYARPLFLFGLILLALVFPFGETIRGTTGWFRLAGFQLQPVEPMKVALVLMLATWLSSRRRGTLSFRDVVITSLLVGLPALCTLLQPDFGSAMILLSIWFALLWFAGLRWSHLVAFTLSSAVVSVVSWFFFLVDYQKARILSFLEPTADPLGRGYNVAQAIIAIGSGGWFGRGLGFGSQSQLKFLPESQTDFILGVIGEELGFVGIFLVISMFALLLLRLAKHAFRSPDDFGGFVLLGSMIVFFSQFTVNMGMNLGLLPVTGLGLPFVSYGGSSLIVMLSLFGMTQSVIIQSKLTTNRSRLNGMKDESSEAF